MENKYFQIPIIIIVIMGRTGHTPPVIRMLLFWDTNACWNK